MPGGLRTARHCVFTGKVVTESGICCCRRIAVAQRLKIGVTQKSFSGAAWIFCMEPIFFGIIKGEQPLVCNGDDRGQWPKQGGAVGAAACRMRVPPKARSKRREPQPAASRASKVAGAFLVLFWHAKENVSGGNAFGKRCETQSTRKRSAREAHLSGFILRHLNNFNKK